MHQAVKAMADMVIHVADFLDDMSYWNFVAQWRWFQAMCLVRDSGTVHRKVDINQIDREYGEHELWGFVSSSL
jgi:hypothetical protein